MKVLIISDSHGNLSNLGHVLGFATSYKIDAIVHAGDWDNLESVEKVLDSEIPLYSVLGNADIDPAIGIKLAKKSKKFAKDFLYFEIDGKKIGVVHRPQDVKNFFDGKTADIIFCGHLHSSNDSLVSGLRVVRPGAIKLGINFAVYNTENGSLEFVKDEQ